MAFANVQEILDNITHLDASKLGGTAGVMSFKLTGEGGGAWTLTLADGKAELEAGESPSPDVTFTMASQDFLDIANGTLNPVSAFMQGKIKVSGDMALAMRLQSLLT